MSSGEIGGWGSLALLVSIGFTAFASLRSPPKYYVFWFLAYYGLILVGLLGIVGSCYLMHVADQKKDEEIREHNARELDRQARIKKLVASGFCERLAEKRESSYSPILYVCKDGAAFNVYP